MSNVNETERASKNAVIFDIFHNGQPVEAVVVGSKITLSFIPYYAIPRTFLWNFSFVIRHLLFRIKCEQISEMMFF